MDSFPKVLRNALISKGIGPAQLAKCLGLNNQTVLSWLNSKALPSSKSLVRLMKELPDHKHELFSIIILSEFWSKIENKYNSKHIKVDHEVVFKQLVSNKFLSETFLKEASNSESTVIFDMFNTAVQLRLYEKKLNEIISDEEEVKEQSSILIMPTPSLEIISNWADITRAITKDSSLLYSLSWERFEDLVAELLKGFGWEIQPLMRTKDDGIDILASTRINPDIPFRMMVQCKRYKNMRKVGIDVVKNVWTTKCKNKFHQAMIATTSMFTRGARDEANLWNIELRGQQELVEWCECYGKIIS